MFSEIAMFEEVLNNFQKNELVNRKNNHISFDEKITPSILTSYLDNSDFNTPPRSNKLNVENAGGRGNVELKQHDITVED